MTTKFLKFRTCKQMVCRDCIVLTHPKAEGHELQELNEVKAEYVVSLEQLQWTSSLRYRTSILINQS